MDRSFLQILNLRFQTIALAIALPACTKFPGRLIHPPNTPAATVVAFEDMRFAFGSPTALYTSDCNPVVLQLQDSLGNAALAPATATATLSHDGTAHFYSDAACTAAISTTGIATGSSSTTIYVLPPAGSASPLVLTAAHAGDQIAEGTKSFPVYDPALLTISDGPSFSFGYTGTGATINKTFTLTNSGATAASSIAASTLSAPFAYEGGSFPGTSGDCTGSLAASSSCTFVVSFAPVAQGIFSGSVSVSYQDGAVAQSANRSISGAGVGAPTQITISGASTLITGSCGPYNIISADANSNPTAALANITVNLAGTGSGSFYTDSGCTTPTTSTTISAGLSAVQLYFQDAVSEALTLTATDASSALTQGAFSLAVSSAGFLTISDGPSYSFGSVPAGSTVQKTFTLSNVGLLGASAISAPVLTSPYSYTGGTFPGGGSCGTTLAAGSSCTFNVSYAPLSTGASSGSVTIIYNDSSTAQVATRSFSGTAVGTPTRVTISGTTNPTADNCYAYTLTTTDGGGSAVGVLANTSITLSGAGSGGFYTNATCTSATASASLTAGASTTTVYFSDATAESLTLTATPTGLIAGTLGIVVLSKASLSISGAPTYNYGGVTTSTATTITFTVTNSGQVAATSLSPTTLAAPFGFAGGTYPGTGGDCGTSLAASSSCTMEIRFAPTAAVTSSATLLIPYNNGSVLAIAQIGLTGLGVLPTNSLSVARGFNFTVNSMLLAADGTSILVGGGFRTYNSSSTPFFTKLKSDMTVDPTFTPGTGPNNAVTKIIEVGDGSGDYYIAGAFTTYNGVSRPGIARVSASGVLNTTFVPTTVGANNVLAMATVQRGGGDHDLYIGGSFTSINGTSINRIARLNSDGTLDSGFNVGTGFNFAVNSLLVDGSNNVYIFGDFNTYNGSTAKGMISLQDDGSVNTTFAVGTTSSSSPSISLAIWDGTGKMYVWGAYLDYNGSGKGNFLRLTTTGAIDTAFSPSGLSGTPTGLLMKPGGSGNLYVSNYTASGGFQVPRFMELSSTGALISNTFNNYASPNSTVAAMAAATDGSGAVYFGGSFLTFNGLGYNRIVKLSSAGVVDAASPVGAGLGYSSISGTLNAIAAVPDGSNRIYVGGLFNAFNGSSKAINIARINPDSTLDTSFFTGSGFTGAVTGITVDSAGLVYVVGPMTLYNGTNLNGIVCLNTDGSINNTFAFGSGFSGDPAVALMQPGGTGIYVGGSFTGYQSTTANRIIRLKPDGSIDTAFNSGTGFDGAVTSIVSVGDGSNDIIVGGAFTNYNGTSAIRIVRLNADGSIDNTLNVGTSFAGGQVSTIAMIPDGTYSMYVGGAFTTYQTVAAQRIVKLGANGTRDTSFATGTVNNTVNVVIVADDGTYQPYVGGAFTNFNGNAAYARLVRVGTNGTVNTSFAAGTSYFGSPVSLLMSPAGTHSVYVGGSATLYGTTTTDFLMRLKANGTLD